MNYGIPGPNASIIPFSVFVIESPSRADLTRNRTEGRLIAEALRLAGVPFKKYSRQTRDSFRKLLKHDIPNYLHDRHESGHSVVVHLSLHGSSYGVELTDKTNLSWADMYPWFTDINYECDGNLVLCMSSCMGAFATLMTLDNVELPFRVLVGSDDEPAWPQTAVGFAVFYHLLQSGRTLQEAAEEMKEASAHEGFHLIDAQTAKDLHEWMTKSNDSFRDQQ